MLFNIDEIDIATSDSGALTLGLRGMSVEVKFNGFGRLSVSDLRHDGRPFPPRGGLASAFEIALAMEIMKAAQSPRSLDHYRDHLTAPRKAG